MGKLLKESVELSVLCHKYQIKELKAELAKLEPAKTPAGKRRKILPFTGKKLHLVDKRIADIKELISKLAKKKIEGVLTPITVPDHYEIQQYYALQRLAAQRTMPKDLNEDGMKDFNDSVDMISNSALQGKNIQVILKKKEKANGKWVRLFEMEDIIKLEPQLMLDILTLYYTEFTLNGEELEKSPAPMKKDS